MANVWLRKILSIICIAFLWISILSVSPAFGEINKNLKSGKAKGKTLLTQTKLCSPEETKNGGKWIKNQLNAFKVFKDNPSAAYKYASQDFQSQVSLDDFVQIINSEYSVLLKIKESKIEKCTLEQGDYVYKVAIKTDKNKDLLIFYALSRINGRWGVDGAFLTDPGFSN